ncbi:GNAT family N-acetyltransferase [Flagellimonas sp. 389]|uniref:GNAT family N-acetyltransferase n=1 Tax=Flagellimonas sp. 389 TaxID=2835862 RepID=UPI001BD26E4F|nr:GNAT family N-acetyltransferase [Flagellimonas sp. 389]MBS9463881.1 GNAT family N-acetyltransferase [Flagellimonas sp. 389]
MISNPFLVHKVQFVFDLFLEKKTTSLYNPRLKNHLTQKSVLTENSFLNIINSKVIIVKDIPDYIEVIGQESHSYKCKKVPQYKGFLINLLRYQDIKDYLIDNLNKRNRKNLFSKRNKLHGEYQIRYECYHKKIDKFDYDLIFDRFYILLEQRFREKKVYNRYLMDWQKLHEETYQKILNGDASLYVIFNEKEPISITLNFHLGDIVFSHIHTYDIEYSKYNLGDINMFANIEWCLDNKISIFDLSMGKTYNKQKWCNYEYRFMYHVYYNSDSLFGRLSSSMVMLKLKLIQYLRNKGIVGNLFQFDKLRYWIKRGTQRL